MTRSFFTIRTGSLYGRCLVTLSLRSRMGGLRQAPRSKSRSRGGPPERAAPSAPVGLETCCRGPVEFDIAHAPEDVGEHYPAANHDLLRECRILMLAMIATWRWDRDDQLPNGRQLGTEWLSQIRAALDR